MVKSEDSEISELEGKLRKAKKEKKIAVEQVFLLRKWFQEVLRYAPLGFVLPHDVCALLCHPLKDTGFCFCQQVFAGASGTPISQIALVAVLKECEKSPDGKHCWHNSPWGLSSTCIPGSQTKGMDICCFCGIIREYEITLPVSYVYSYNEADHGPFAPKYVRY
jgi:hypothetical protein